MKWDAKAFVVRLKNYFFWRLLNFARWFALATPPKAVVRDRFFHRMGEVSAAVIMPRIVERLMQENPFMEALKTGGTITIDGGRE